MADGDDARVGEDELLDRLVAAIEHDLEEQRRPPPLWQRLLTPVTVALSALGLGWTIWSSQQQSRESAEQFERTLRASQYADIVNGMASSSVGVQVNSIRRLRQYVAERDNFDSDRLQEEAAQNAAQTLTAFIEDESTVRHHEGLTDYRDPQPVVVSRALDQLVELTGLEEDGAASSGGDTRFPDLAVDLSRGNFHGVPAANFSPEGPFIAVGADFRGAALPGWDLTDVDSPVLSSAFFTCANLQTADLGTADVSSADFTGANLRGTDLSEVRNLSTDQLSGALTGDETELPPGVEGPPQPGWGVTRDGDVYRPSTRCRSLMDRMTDLLAGAGYSSRIPCPDESDAHWTVRLSVDQRTVLERVCRLRGHGTTGPDGGGADAP